jgi:hypothetical protein
MVLLSEEQATWERWPRSTTVAAGLVRRGNIIRLLAAGHSHAAVGRAVGVQRTVVRTWAQRLLAQRLAAGPRVVFPPEVAIHVVRLACERPESLGRSLSPWDGTELARQLIAAGVVEGLSAATVRRILACHHLKPWRPHLWLSPKCPRDAAFAASISALIDLYTRLVPDDEVVLSVEETTS